LIALAGIDAAVQVIGLILSAYRSSAPKRRGPDKATLPVGRISVRVLDAGRGHEAFSACKAAFAEKLFS
jgi:hypothetical protein